MRYFKYDNKLKFFCSVKSVLYQVAFRSRTRRQGGNDADVLLCTLRSRRRSKRSYTIERNLVLIGICLLSLMSCSSFGAKDTEKQENYYYNIGVSRLAEKNFPEAIKAIEQVININYNHFEAHNLLGLIYLELKDYDKSVNEFSISIKINADFIDARNNLGVTYLRMEQYDNALNILNSIVENPLYASSNKSLNAYRHIGDIYYKKGKYAEAINILKKAIVLSHDFYPAYYMMALCLNKTGKYGYAIEALTSAIEADPEFTGNMEKARKEFNKKVFLLEGRDKQDAEDYLEIMNY